MPNKRKKVKSGASGAADVVVDDAVADPGVSVADGAPEAVCDAVNAEQDLPEVSCGVTLECMRKLKRAMTDFVYAHWEQEKVGKLLGILDHCNDYENLLVELLTENERLRGRLEVLTSKAYTAKVASAAAKAAVKAVVPVAAPVAAPVAQPAVVPVATPAAVAAAVSAAVPAVISASVPKPVETWSVVVRGKKGVSSKEIIDKVVKQVGPTLGVRVHEVKPTRDGGAVIRMPSVVERERVVKNKKFEEIGLEVTVNEKTGPRVLVSGVEAGISPEEFMSDLFEMNYSECMSLTDFKKKVRLASKPWKSDAGGLVNVVLEGEDMAMRRILETGRVYVKWYSFKVRLQDSIPHCFRCLGFDHRVRECRMREDVCRLCGKSGHRAMQCDGVVRCRDCEFRRLPADHPMLSNLCPVYVGLVARANARH